MKGYEHQRRAQARADKVSESTDYEEMTRCAREALKAPPLAHKVFWLHRMADELGKAAKGHLACDNGCSYCCYQPVMMTYTEARYIGRKTGIIPNVPRYYTEPKQEYIGRQCPFLKEGKCSIYKYRPFACRTYFSLDDDSSECEILDPDNPGIVAQMNTMQFHAVLFEALGEAVFEMADIRDFFRRKF